MSNQEILEKAIQKAIDGGWNVFGSSYEYFGVHLYNDNGVIFNEDFDGGRNFWKSPEEIIFNHDFAKALWGEAKLDGLAGVLAERDILTGSVREHYWQYHLQQMVIAENPIEYLGVHIDG